jgi:hypothetical protein
MKVKALRSVKEIKKGNTYEAKGVWTDSLSGEDFYQTILDNERIVLYHVSHFKVIGEEDVRIECNVSE